MLLKDNPSLQADMVVLAIGVTPDTALAKKAGLELGIKGSIVVNERMETSVPDIYAAGDAVQVKHYVTGDDALISLAGPALSLIHILKKITLTMGVDLSYLDVQVQKWVYEYFKENGFLKPVQVE